MVAESAGVDPALRAWPAVVPLVRRFLPLLAAVVLMAPSCPDLGPADFDPESRRPFAPYSAGSDLVYVSAGSARGSSMYVVAMPEGRVVSRIDGPDSPWIPTADRRTAFYTVTRFDSGGQQILHHVDLHSGVRLLRVDTGSAEWPRARGSDFIRLQYGSLALTGDGDLWLARVEGTRRADGGPAEQHVGLYRFNTRTGGRTAARSWPGSIHGTQAWLVSPRPNLLLLARALVDPRLAVTHEWLFLREDVVEVASLSSARGELPADTHCDPRLRDIPGGNMWVTICAAERAPEIRPDALTEPRRDESRPVLDPDVRSPAQPQQRASVALFIDPETLRPVGRVALSPAGDAARELGPPVDWTVLQDGSVLVVTGRGALVRVSETAVEKTFVDGRRSALAVSAQALLAPDGRALYMWLRTESSPARLARVEVRTGAVFASTTLEGAEGIGHGLAPDGSTLYVTARHGGEQGTRVHALDPITLIERGRSDLVREPPSAGLIELVVSTR